MRRSSSSRPFASSHRTSVALPDIPMSPSDASLICRSCVATSPDTSVVLVHVALSSEFDTTYFAMLLMNGANGASSPWLGQYDDHSSYRTRPMRNPVYLSVAWPI